MKPTKLFFAFLLYALCSQQLWATGINIGPDRVIGEGASITLTAIIELPGLRDEVFPIKWYKRTFDQANYPTTTFAEGAEASFVTETLTETTYFKAAVTDAAGVFCEDEVVVVVAKLKKVLFHESHPIYRDPEPVMGNELSPLSLYTPTNPQLPTDAHWSKENGIINAYPVCYTRSTSPANQTHIKVSALINLNGLSTANPIDINLANTTIRAIASANGFSAQLPPQTLNSVVGMNADDYLMPISEFDSPLGNIIDILEPLTITWTCKTNNDIEWSSMAATENTVYVTLNNPQLIYELDDAVTPANPDDNQYLFLTTLHLSCLNARGLDGSNETLVVNNIYNEFTDQNVQRIGDNAQLKYWGATGINNGLNHRQTRELLQRGDARCGAWARFFIDMLCAQGITSAEKYNLTRTTGTGLVGLMIPNAEYTSALALLNQDLITAGISCTTPLYLYSYILIKNWNIPNADGQFYLPISETFNEEVFYKFNTTTDIALEGVSAQGNPDPKSYFQDHSIVKYGNGFYDPSYGSHSGNGTYNPANIPYSSVIDWENKNVVALSCVLDCPNGTLWWVEKMNNTTQQDFMGQDITNY